MRTKTPQAASYARAEVTYRQPTAKDGFAVWQTVGRCPPLDQNALYCYSLQCSDFSDTCIVAEAEGDTIGWVSAYLPPKDPASLFVWQVAVVPEARGLRLARSMIGRLLQRPSCKNVRNITATVTPNNKPSWALFNSIAASLNAPLSKQLRFDEEGHFKGRQESEYMVTIGPFAPV